MTDLPAPSTINEDLRLVVRQEMQAVAEQLQRQFAAMLLPYATVETVKQLIEAALIPVRDVTHTQLVSIDNHLRASEANLSNAVRDVNRVAETLTQAVTETRAAAAAIRGSDEARQRQFAALEDRFNDHDEQADEDRRELMHTVHRLDMLHGDVHGVANEPHRVSVYSMLTARRDEANSQFRQLMAEMGGLQARVAAHDQWISTRHRIEVLVYSSVKGVANSRWGKLALLAAVLAVFGSLPGVEIWQKLLEVLTK